MKKVFMALCVVGLSSLSVFADVQADGANFCPKEEFSTPIRYVALKDTNSYGDALADGYIEQAIWKGHKIKKGTVVKVYAIGNNCNEPKTLFMNTDDIGFTGVKMSDFKKVK